MGEKRQVRRGRDIWRRAVAINTAAGLRHSG